MDSNDSLASTDQPTAAYAPFTNTPATQVVTQEGKPLFDDTNSNGSYHYGGQESVLKTPIDYDSAEETEEPRSNRRLKIMVGALGAVLLAGIGGTYLMVGRGETMTAEEKANLPQAVPTSVASPAPAKHKHKQKPTHVASQTPETKPTHAATTEPAAPAAPETLNDPSAAPVPTGPTSFRIGSLDIYTSQNDNDEKYSIDKWQERLAKSDKVVEKHLDVFGMRDLREKPWHPFHEAHKLGKDNTILPAQ
jgi:hypothetical protein